MNTTQFLEAFETALQERKDRRLKTYSHIHGMGRRVVPMRLSLTRTGPRSCPVTFLANHIFDRRPGFVARDFRQAGAQLLINNRTLEHIMLATDLNNAPGHLLLRDRMYDLIVRHTTRVR
jgi:hypothetical protein